MSIKKNVTRRIYFIVNVLDTLNKKLLYKLNCFIQYNYIYSSIFDQEENSIQILFDFKSDFY